MTLAYLFVSWGRISICVSAAVFGTALTRRSGLVGDAKSHLGDLSTADGFSAPDPWRLPHHTLPRTSSSVARASSFIGLLDLFPKRGPEPNMRGNQKIVNKKDRHIIHTTPHYPNHYPNHQTTHSFAYPQICRPRTLTMKTMKPSSNLYTLVGHPTHPTMPQPS